MIRGLGLPFYKDIISHGNLYIEFIVEFPKKNSFTKSQIEAFSKILKGKIPNTDKYATNDK